MLTTAKYYFFGGQRVALRRDNALYYVHSDHLRRSPTRGSSTTPTAPRGRPASLRQPNVAFAVGASERYTYSDSTQPFKVEHWRRDDSASDGVLYDYTFYDGLL